MLRAGPAMVAGAQGDVIRCSLMPLTRRAVADVVGFQISHRVRQGIAPAVVAWTRVRVESRRNAAVVASHHDRAPVAAHGFFTGYIGLWVAGS